MIWFSQVLPTINPPEDQENIENILEVLLVGEFNPNQQPFIQICLEVGGERYQLFTHAPSGRIPEDVDPEDILAKYNHKIAKFKDRFSNEKYAEIVKMVHSRYPEAL